MGSAVELDSSLVAQMASLKDELKAGTADCRPAVIHTKVDSFIDGIHDNLERRMFMYVPQEDATYWDNLGLFGYEFKVVFPLDAIRELREVCNCFVASRGTACVFHCMRVAEYGLRKLAKKVGVKITHKGKPMPIELATWDKVIGAIRSKITAKRQQQKGLSIEARLQFYSNAADHCEYMKDIWRNEVSHSRKRAYSREEASGVTGSRVPQLFY